MHLEIMQLHPGACCRSCCVCCSIPIMMVLVVMVFLSAPPLPNVCHHQAAVNRIRCIRCTVFRAAIVMAISMDLLEHSELLVCTVCYMCVVCTRQHKTTDRGPNGTPSGRDRVDRVRYIIGFIGPKPNCTSTFSRTGVDDDDCANVIDDENDDDAFLSNCHRWSM